MQIGTSIQANALSLLRLLAAGEGVAQGATGSVAGERGHHHNHRSHHDRVNRGEGGDEARLQGRLQRLSAMLQKLTELNPDARGASYAAIVIGGRGGAVAVASTPAAGVPGDTLVIQAQSIRDVTTGSGDDRVILQGTTVNGIYTGGGSDAVAIVASFVSGIHTDAAGPVPVTPPAAPPPEPDVAAEVPVAEAAPMVPLPVPEAEAAPVEVDTSGSATGSVAAPVVAGNDALSVAAYLIRDIATGGGDDALALAGRVVADVDAGAGNDAVAIRAGVVTGVTGGEGDDAIAVDAKVGVAGVSNAAGWFAVAAEPLVASTVGATAQVGQEAARAYADIDGGAGNDVISVRTASVLAVAGGTGNDTVNVAGGTV